MGRTYDLPDPVTIDVIVSGGAVQNILGIPEGTTVRLIDYDVDGSPDNTRLVRFEDEPWERAFVSEFEHDPTEMQTMELR